MKTTRIALSALAVAGIAWAATPGISSASAGAAKPKTIKPYDHIIEIMMENTSYSTIIGNANAPAINHLASTYGDATNYFGVTHPSEPNYMANIAGDYFGVQDDNQFYCTAALATTDPTCAGTTVDHTVNAPTIADICRRLDGVALAIELAARRVESYGLQQTAALLDQRLPLRFDSTSPQFQFLTAAQ